MPRINKFTLAGFLLILAAVAVPSMVWVGAFRGVPPDSLREHLALGAFYFRAGLAALGIFVFWMPRLLSLCRPAARVIPESSPASRAAIGAILAVALGLRLYRLDSGLWLDEILTYVNYARLPFAEILTTYASENQHFLYSLMAHACFQLFGEGAWALRLPAVLFGVASVGALYLLGREVAGVREGLFAAALLTFSYHHVWFSQNARGYTGLLFFTILSSWLLIRAFNEDRPSLWFAYAGAAALGVYTHTTMMFVIAGHGLSYVLEQWRRHRRGEALRWAGLFLGFLAAALLTWQLYSLVAPQVLSAMARTVSVVEAWKKPLWTLLEFSRGLNVNFAGAVAALCALLVFGAGLWRYARSRPTIVEMLLLPPLLGASLVMAVGHHLWPRFFFFAFGFGALVVVGGLFAVEEAARGLRLPGSHRLGSVACVLLILMSAASVPRAFGPKQDYLAALTYALAQRRDGDIVVSTGLASFPYTTLYRSGIESVEDEGALTAVRARGRRTILLYTLEPVIESMQPRVMSMIRRDFKVMKKFGGTLQGGTVFVCIAEGPGPSQS